MKTKILLTTVVFLITIRIFSQIPNPGFEIWEDSGLGYEDPKNWATGNVFETNVTKTTDSYSGNYAMKLSTTSTAIYGTFAYSKFPISYNPAHLNFTYKFTFGGDTIMIMALFQKWNGQSSDVVGMVIDTIANNQTSYVSTSVPITYISQQIADTVVLQVISGLFYPPVGGSVLYIDDFSFSGSVGINSFSEVQKVKIYPNPASDILFVEMAEPQLNATIIIYNLTGQAVLSQALNGRTAEIKLNDLPNGIYVYKIYDEQEGIIKADKVLINH